MKRIIALTLMLALLLCGCGGIKEPASQDNPAAPETAEAPTLAPTEATTEPTTVPTTEPIVYFDPLNGEILEAPYDGRIFASTVANENDPAIPHVNVQKADILIEAFVNNSKTRCLALFSQPDDVEAIGSTRSTRIMFNDIVQHYNAILSHAGGSSACLGDAKDRGIVNYNVDSLMRQGDPLMQGTAYRDKDHPKIKYGDANLYAILPGVKAYAESQGVPVSGMPETDYGLLFTEDGAPSGEDAASIQIQMVCGKSKKDTTMVYNAELDKYVFNQYGKEMHELFTEEPEAFQNVVIMQYTPKPDVHFSGAVYYEADFVAGGTGYYANGGKLIPMVWSCESEESPFRFFHEDGTPLAFGQGNTYINLCTPESTITWGEPAAN